MIVILWEFQTKPGMEREYERASGANGLWIQLFRKGEGYLGTELLKGSNGRYITIDRWTSFEAYERFKKEYAEEYEKIDKACESFTRFESLIGIFEPQA